MSQPNLPPASPFEPRDSVAPLSAGSTGRTRAFQPPGARGRALFAGVATLALALGSAAALRARPASGAALPERAATTGDTLPAEQAAAPVESASPVEAAVPVESAAPVASTAPDEAPLEDDDTEPRTLEDQRRRLFARMEEALGIDDEAMGRVEAIFAASPVLGQGNPAISRHPMKRSECRRIRAEARLEPAHVAACGAPNMVPIFDAEAGDTAVDAPLCIDQFEFPDIPCEYPVTNVRASEAAQLCEAVGKRLCDAHEWEGACAGSLRPPDVEYAWGWPRLQATYAHNVKREKVWAYGPQKDHALCATGSVISPECTGGGWMKCGSNTYPAGAFPACVSSFGVYDQHGNAAEHMSLPTVPEELASRGGDGFTEMKGSWFVFGTIQAHEDDCRFRAPAWHETRVSNPNSHRNYHLGFRCCKDVEER